MGKRAAKFLRVSSSSQDEAMQEPDIDRRIADGGMECVKTYKLRASASKGRHQGLLDTVLADAREGKFDVLIAWLPDRLERRGAFRAIHWLQEVLATGVQVVFAEPTRGPRYDLSTPRGQEELARAASYAAEETELRMMRTETGRNLAKSNDGVLTAPPWGYVVTGPKHHKSFSVTDDGREWIPVVFKRICEMSLGKLQKSLAGTPLEGRSETALAKLVRNRTYLGYITSKDGRTIGRCEPLVGARLWNKANKALNERPATGGRKPGAECALLAGVSKCPSCAAQGRTVAMYRTATGRYHYYRCDKRRGGCGYMVRLDAADALVNKSIAGLDREITVRTLVERGHDFSEEIARCELDLRQLASLGLDYEAEDARRAELRAELTRLRSLPATEDVWKDVGIGRTFANEYMATANRNDWLRDHALTTYLAKDETAILLLLDRIAQTARDADQHQYSIETDGNLTAVIYWGSSLAA